MSANTVEDGVRLLAPRAAEKGLELACRIAPDVPDMVVGDSGRLRQVILNLVGNAMKFTETGEVMLDVAVEQVTANEVVLRFRVTDTGIGIAEDKLWTIFGAFVQADASTTRRYGGTGLGLTISAQLVELMGGRIWIESEVGKGSRFHFLAHFGLAPVSTEPLVPQAGNLPYLRVLIVDDNATNRLILTEILAGWKLRATAVDSAMAALSALARGGRASRAVRPGADRCDDARRRRLHAGQGDRRRRAARGDQSDSSHLGGARSLTGIGNRGALRRDSCPSPSSSPTCWTPS